MRMNTTNDSAWISDAKHWSVADRRKSVDLLAFPEKQPHGFAEFGAGIKPGPSDIYRRPIRPFLPLVIS